MTTDQPIIDPADPRLDDYRSLDDQGFRRRYEGDTNRFIAEGLVALDRLVASDHTIRSVLVAPSRLERLVPMRASLAARDVAVYVADRDVIASVVGFDLHRGVVACAERRPLAAIDELAATAHLLVVLEGLNDNENLGAIARTAKAFGVDGVILDPSCTDPYSRRSVRVSMGEVLTTPIARAAPDRWPDVLVDLVAVGFDVWAMTPSVDAEDLWSLDAAPRVAVMLGAEGPGLSSRSIEAATRSVRIPIAPEVDSLNVGHAAAVTLAEIRRRPRAHSAGPSRYG
jgi:tRNA G18 (ribose-2'-O)-methylase SpoU